MCFQQETTDDAEEEKRNLSSLRFLLSDGSPNRDSAPESEIRVHSRDSRAHPSCQRAEGFPQETTEDAEEEEIKSQFPPFPPVQLQPYREAGVFNSTRIMCMVVVPMFSAA